MKNHYIRSNSNRQTNSSTYSNSQVLNKNQLASKLKVIDFLKDHLYPTGNKSNWDFFFKKQIFYFSSRFINLIISIRKSRFISKETFIKSTYSRNSSKIDESYKSSTKLTWTIIINNSFSFVCLFDVVPYVCRGSLSLSLFTHRNDVSVRLFSLSSPCSLSLSLSLF